ncbi:hypothetical protein FHG87_007767 [Trinorchestia longiramus]|nr:hypothetical protein FHG87_007767 [Trinorchestia longiramus]
MPVSYSLLALEEPDDDEDEVVEEETVSRGCLDTLRGALPKHLVGSDYVPLSTAADHATLQSPSPLKSSSSSCLDLVLRSVPSFRSHSRYSSVPFEDCGSDEDVVYETPLESDAVTHQNGDLQLQYDDHLHLLSTAHGVHGVQVPYQTRGSLRRIPAAATRLVRKANTNSTISKGVKVLRKKVRGVRWSQTSRLCCRWLLNYKCVLPIVSLIMVIVLISSTVKQTGRIAEDLHTEHELLMTIKKSLEHLSPSKGSIPAASTERIVGSLGDYELHRQANGGQNTNIWNVKELNHTTNFVKNNRTLNAPKPVFDELVQIMPLLHKVESDAKKLSGMSDILLKIDRNLDILMTRSLLADKLVPKYGINIRKLSSTARSSGSVLPSESTLFCHVYVSLVCLVMVKFCLEVDNELY